MTVVIRPAIPSDDVVLLAIWEHSVRATHAFLTQADIASLHPLVAEELASGSLELWVLTDAGEPCGWMGLSGAKIEALFPAPEARGQGGGRKLIDHAQALRGGPLTVDVNEQNPGARGFYERLGFVVTGRSELDGGGRPFPLLHLRRPAPGDVGGSDPG
jgi:putative acetyltransferase